MIAGLEALDRGADLVNDADRLVTQGEVVARADSAVDRVHVGGADEGLGGFDDGVGRAGSGNRFISESDLANPVHHEGSHRGRPPIRSLSRTQYVDAARLVLAAR